MFFAFFFFVIICGDEHISKLKQKDSIDLEIINLNPSTISDYGVCGYKNVEKHVELRKKIAWFNHYYPKGLRIKVLIEKNGGYQGMIESIPGQYVHRPVEAKGYLFIHCIFVGFKKEYKGKGLASLLIDACIKDAKKEKMMGVAVVSRKGSFMVGKNIFLKKGFLLVDSVKPDFDLLVLKFSDEYANPTFKNLGEYLKPFENGLFIFRSPQCPYTEKNVNAIISSAKNKFNLKPQLIELDSVKAVQQSPCPFGSFCIIYDGDIIAHHPISNTRFENMMNKLIKN